MRRTGPQEHAPKAQRIPVLNKSLQLRLTVEHVGVADVIIAARLTRMVELVGLEPTTSSLRTMRSPN